MENDASKEWLANPAKSIDQQMKTAALDRQAQLTKPPGSLGQLEDIAVKLCGLQGTENPQADNVFITVFAADHGIAEEGVSAFPQIVTTEMVNNFARGGAAISVLAQQLSARFRVVSLGTVGDTLASESGVQLSTIAPSTVNFCRGEAMTEQQLEQALGVGRELIDELVSSSNLSTATARPLDLFIAGDMGIGNTTAAAAIICALMQADPTVIVGPGTGVDREGLARKIDAVERALALHHPKLRLPHGILRCLGGFEIAAIAGSYIRCAQHGIPLLVDGFVTTAAAMVALAFNPTIKPWMIFSHCSAEPAHRRVLDYCEVEPLLDMGMRLGEASGAAMAVPLIRLACALHNKMASFASAGVSVD